MAGFPVGAVLGGLLGAQLVAWLGRTEDLLLATALAQAAFAALVWATGRRYASLLGSTEPRATPSRARGRRRGRRRDRFSLRRALASRFVALILAYQVLSALGSQLVRLPGLRPRGRPVRGSGGPCRVSSPPTRRS